MPFLRFSRDKHGNEITSLHHAVRRHGKSRPRILYWFRTPPNIKVGRAALDENAIRAIEESHPEIEFDWPAILGQVPGKEEAGRSRTRAEAEARRGVERAAADRGGRPRDGRARAGEERPSRQRPEDRPSGEPEAERPVSIPSGETAAPSWAEQAAEIAALDEAARQADEQDAAAREAAALLEAEEPPAHGFPLPDETPQEPPAPASQAVIDAIGAENTARLRARYAELLARISERVADPARQEELREEAERLNPDAWVTPEDVRQALEHYEAVYASIRRVVGERRRRARRGGARRAGRGQGATRLGEDAALPDDSGGAVPHTTDQADGEDPGRRE